MATETQLPVLLINIERAAARRRLIESQAQELGIRLVAVAGVDGAAVPQEAWQDVDLDLFRRRNGRPMMPGEYGCYRSHLNALAHLVESGQEAAIIIEDDVALSQDLMQRAAAIRDVVPGDAVVKLVNHRIVAFRETAVSALGDPVGRCLFGPQGSAACYLVTRGAAQRLLARLLPMSLPFDMALERVWSHQVPVLSAKDNLLSFGSMRQDTMIAHRVDYRQHKLRGWQKMPTHLFRTGEAWARARAGFFA
ncbi:glycosyltransferase family 25 protein [Rhizobium sp. SGZ-381]|uniref:glycosyltransferase family 25 protein n=1 Tax=Rhizobium sp. SGZ-381 TaxID=3342800 RepID=UPI003672D969